MGQILREATVEEWTEFLFARPVDEPAWYWETDADRWEGSPERTVELLAETFERSGELLEPFDDEQVGQGLWMIASSSGPDIVRPLLDEAVPWDLRKRALESIFILFHDCFAVRCSNLRRVCVKIWVTLPGALRVALPESNFLTLVLLPKLYWTLSLLLILAWLLLLQVLKRLTT